MTEAEAKYKALKLAIECRAAVDKPETLVERAGIFYAFIGSDKATGPAVRKGKSTIDGQA